MAVVPLWTSGRNYPTNATVLGNARQRLTTDFSWHSIRVARQWSNEKAKMYSNKATLTSCHPHTAWVCWVRPAHPADAWPFDSLESCPSKSSAQKHLKRRQPRFFLLPTLLRTTKVALLERKPTGVCSLQGPSTLLVVMNAAKPDVPYPLRDTGRGQSGFNSWI